MSIASDFQDRLELIKRNLVDIVREDELQDRVRQRELRCYIGYEPPSRVHIGWLVWMLKLRDMQSAGVDVIILEATWHAWINDKGSLEELNERKWAVRRVLSKLGVNAKFVDSSELLQDPEYVRLLIKSAKQVSLDRVRRAVLVMGRSMSEVEQDFSKILYPLMQAVDALYLKVDFAIGCIDQKQAFLMARDIAERLGLKKPIILCTPTILGLKISYTDSEVFDEQAIAALYKMSQARPDDAIFIDDTPELIENKIMSATCPPRDTLLNPVLKIVEYIIIPYFGKITISTDKEIVEIGDPAILEQLYAKGMISPEELKRVCVEYLTKLLENIR